MNKIYAIEGTVISRRPKLNKSTLYKDMYESIGDARARMHELSKSVFESKDNDRYEKSRIVHDDMDTVFLKSRRSGHTIREFYWEIVPYMLKLKTEK